MTQRMPYFPELDDEENALLTLLAKWIEGLSDQEKRIMVRIIAKGSYTEDILGEGATGWNDL